MSLLPWCLTPCGPEASACCCVPRAVRLRALDRPLPRLRHRPREPAGRRDALPRGRRPGGAHHRAPGRRRRRAARRRDAPRRPAAARCAVRPAAVLRLGRAGPAARADRRPAARLPAAAPARSVRGADHVDHRAAGLAVRRGRDPQPAGRAARRAGRRGVGVPDPRSDRRRGRAARWSRSASRGARPSTRSVSRAATSISTASPTLDDDEVRAADHRSCAGSARGRPSGSSRATSPARTRGRPATSRSARRPRVFTVSP